MSFAIGTSQFTLRGDAPIVLERLAHYAAALPAAEQKDGATVLACVRIIADDNALTYGESNLSLDVIANNENSKINLLIGHFATRGKPAADAPEEG